MELKSFTRGMKSIKFTRVINPGSETASAPEEEQTITAHEVPLPELGEAFDSLKSVVCEVMGFKKDYAVDMTVRKLSINVTKNGTRAARIWYSKALETIGGNPHKMDTPFFKIDPPGDGESGEIQVKPQSAELVKTAIREAERYAEGERSQQLFSFDEDKQAANAQFRDKDQTELAGV